MARAYGRLLIKIRLEKGLAKNVPTYRANLDDRPCVCLVVAVVVGGLFGRGRMDFVWLIGGAG
jgi:hypothetical protein